MLYSVDFYKRFGWPDIKFERSEMMLLVLPEWITNNLPQLPKKIYCNKQMEIPLLTAFYNIIDRNLEKELLTWDGCFLVRAIRGYEKKLKQYLDTGQYLLAAKFISVHAFGCAVDINAKENPLGKVPKMSPELVKCFTDAGFIWGGEWSRPDGMHFQLEYLN